MSIVSDAKTCKICGANTFYQFDCSTSELDETCESCGFETSTEVAKHNGRKFWVETVWYPMDADGKVRRPTKLILPKT